METTIEASHISTMTVRVIDRAEENRRWGSPSSYAGPVIRTIEISKLCPKCGELRGEPYGHNFHEDGGWYFVNRWDNSCGHVDMYDSVLEEAKQNA